MSPSRFLPLVSMATAASSLSEAGIQESSFHLGFIVRALSAAQFVTYFQINE